MSKRRGQNEEKWIEIIERKKKSFGIQEEEVSVKKHHEMQSQRRQEDVGRRGGWGAWLYLNSKKKSTGWELPEL